MLSFVAADPESAPLPTGSSGGAAPDWFDVEGKRKKLFGFKLFSLCRNPGAVDRPQRPLQASRTCFACARRKWTDSLKLETKRKKTLITTTRSTLVRHQNCCWLH